MKKILICILSSFLVSILLTAIVSAEFKDVNKKHWAYNNVNYMVSYGIVNGYEDDTFRPDNNVLRCEWAKLLTTTAFVPTYKNYKTVIENCATDVDVNEWYASYIVSLMPYFDFDEKSNGDGSVSVIFKPEQPATRLEITKSIVIQKGFDVSNPDYTLVTGFKDYSKIPEEDLKYVAVAVEKGIINGFTDKTFRPNANVTRAEAVTILYRAYLKKEEYVEEEEVKPYTMSKLVSADILKDDKYVMAVLDGKNIFYYIDAADNCIYKMNLVDRKKELYFDANKLYIENNEEENYEQYSKFISTQIYYDYQTGKILLNGYFSNYIATGKKPEDKCMYMYVFDITDNTEADIYFVYASDNRYRKGYIHKIEFILDNEYIFLNNGDIVKYDISTGKNTGETFYISGYYHKNFGYVSSQIFKNDIYYVAYPGSMLRKYNYSEGRFTDITEGMYGCDAFGMKIGYYYFWNSNENEFYKLNIKNKLITTLDVTSDFDYLEFSDMGSFTDNNISPFFFVVDDETFIFYDNKMKAYRILEKTPIVEPVVPVPYLVGSDFYKKYEVVSTSKKDDKPAVDTDKKEEASKNNVSEYYRFEGSWVYKKENDSSTISINFSDGKMSVVGVYSTNDAENILFMAYCDEKNISDGKADFSFTDGEGNVIEMTAVMLVLDENDESFDVFGVSLKSVNGEKQANGIYSFKRK